MRLVIHDFGGYPFTAQLARALAAGDHDVTYLYAAGIKAPRARVEPHATDPESIAYRGIALEERYHRQASLRRLRQERRYGRLLHAQITKLRPDVVISANCPIDAQAMAQDAAQGVNAAFVHWCQDIYSLAVSRLLSRRLGLAGELLARRFARLERDVARRSHAVVLITEDFRPLMREWRVPVDNTFVIENWAPLDEIAPTPKSNAWAWDHGLAETPTFLYAGTLGRKHDPDHLVRLARAHPTAAVVVAAEGSGADELRARPDMPPNLQILTLQPTARQSEMLGSADVLVALLEDDAREFSVPSKVLTYLAAGRPVLAAIPPENLAARTISKAHAGIVVRPADQAEFARAACSLLADKQKRSSMGQAARTYALREFSIERKAAAFEQVLSTARASR